MTTGGNKHAARKRLATMAPGPHHPSPVLEIQCIKVKFTSEADARKAQKRQHPYRCRLCGAWGMWVPGWSSWGTVDEVTANVCSDGCKRIYRPRRRRAAP